MWLFWLAIIVVSIVAMWKIFTKAGELGWKSIIPVYHIYILYKIAWGNGWVFLALIVPIVNFVVAIMLQFKLARAFGKSAGFAMGLIFLGPIFQIILGLDDSKYIGPDGIRANGQGPWGNDAAKGAEDYIEL